MAKRIFCIRALEGHPCRRHLPEGRMKEVGRLSSLYSLLSGIVFTCRMSPWSLSASRVQHPSWSKVLFVL